MPVHLCFPPRFVLASSGVCTFLCVRVCASVFLSHVALAASTAWLLLPVFPSVCLCVYVLVAMSCDTSHIYFLLLCICVSICVPVYVRHVVVQTRSFHRSGNVLLLHLRLLAIRCRAIWSHCTVGCSLCHEVEGLLVNSEDFFSQRSLQMTST